MDVHHVVIGEGVIIKLRKPHMEIDDIDYILCMIISRNSVNKMAMASLIFCFEAKNQMSTIYYTIVRLWIEKFCMALM